MKEITDYESRRKLYEKALEKWGADSQVDMLIEEMSELTQVLLHIRRANRDVTVEELSDEIADVEIMLEQVKVITECDYIVSLSFEKKLKKLKKYLKEENQEGTKR